MDARPHTVRPLLRWAGSKRQLVPTIVSLAPPAFSRYVEPFAGSAAVFFGLQPQSAILADLNTELINFYREVVADAAKVYGIATAHPSTKESYYAVRSKGYGSSSAERAGNFLFLNRLSFNGIYRTNRLGMFNVPYGAEKAGAFPAIEEVVAASHALKAAEFMNADFETTLASAREGDFCYIDPPYYTDSSRVFAEYDQKTFSAPDLTRLQASLSALADKGARFMLSYQDGPEAERLSKDYRVVEVNVRRTVASRTARRGKVGEVLIMNYEGISC